jgi:hypothetical protein
MTWLGMLPSLNKLEIEMKKLKRKALSYKNVPRSLNLQIFATAWLLLDRLNPPLWAWGMVGTLCGLIFIVKIIDFLEAEDFELPNGTELTGAR